MLKSLENIFHRGKKKNLEASFKVLFLLFKSGSLVSHLYFGLALCHHTIHQNVLNNQLYITHTLYEC